MEKTIVEKLKLTTYLKKAILNKPMSSSYLTELSDADNELKATHYDMIFAFVLDFNMMKAVLDEVITGKYLNEKGYLFIAYPKKGNKRYTTFIHRDEILPGLGVDEAGYLPGSSLKFSRMVAMDETYTVVGIKEAGKEKKKKKTAASQRVVDYQAYIPTLKMELQDYPTEYAFYESLTAGYQRDWARYVYSAKQESTQIKRKAEMIGILSQGFKSRELYRQSL